MIRKKRDPRCLAQFRKTYECGRDRRVPLITGLALVRVKQTLWSGPCPPSPHFWAQGSWDGSKVPPPRPVPSLFPSGWLHSQTDVPPLSGEKEKFKYVRFTFNKIIYCHFTVCKEGISHSSLSIQFTYISKHKQYDERNHKCMNKRLKGVDSEIFTIILNIFILSTLA